MSKNITFPIVASILLFWAGWAWITPSPERQDPNPSGDPCYLFTEDAEYLEFDLRLHLRDDKIVPFRVPIDYIEDRKMYPNGGELTAKGFRVGMEHFEPVSRFESHIRNKAGIWDWMSFLVQSLLPLEELALISAHLSSGERRDSIDNYELILNDFGMKRLDYKVRIRSFETYIIENPVGQISDVFKCSPIGSVPFPICIHHFEYNDITVKVSYRRTELSEWRDTRAKLEQFLSCATDGSS